MRDWPEFRLEHLTDDDASTARQLAASHGVRFLGGTGTCVVDAYVTKVKAHHFTELACFVQGKTSSSVIIAAAPTASWADGVRRADARSRRLPGPMTAAERGRGRRPDR